MSNKKYGKPFLIHKNESKILRLSFTTQYMQKREPVVGDGCVCVCVCKCTVFATVTGHIELQVKDGVTHKILFIGALLKMGHNFLSLRFPSHARLSISFSFKGKSLLLGLCLIGMMVIVVSIGQLIAALERYFITYDLQETPFTVFHFICALIFINKIFLSTHCVLVIVRANKNVFNHKLV